MTILLQCDACDPLYNDKPPIRGQPCRKCQCFDHAHKCFYNQSIDAFPNDDLLGGGGVCVDCKHNTTGQSCDWCIDGFFRKKGRSLKREDVCEVCACDEEGSENPGVCEKVSKFFQFNIKINYSNSTR